MLQRDFPAEQFFPAADHALCVGQTFRGQHAVAAPSDMHGIHVAVFETETGGAGSQEQGRVKVGASGHGELLKAADGERLTLR